MSTFIFCDNSFSQISKSAKWQLFPLRFSFSLSHISRLYPICSFGDRCRQDTGRLALPIGRVSPRLGSRYAHSEPRRRFRPDTRNRYGISWPLLAREAFSRRSLLGLSDSGLALIAPNGSQQDRAAAVIPTSAILVG